MASLSFRVDGHEVARHRLQRPLVIGRSDLCDISIRDLLLSRQHCRIDFDGMRWVVTDLHSRNGTWFDDQQVASRVLRDGDHFRIGTIRIFFLALSGEPSHLRGRLGKNSRPAEPARGGFATRHPSASIAASPLEYQSRAPQPLPRPSDPVSYSRENLYGLFARIAASSRHTNFDLPARANQRSRPTPRPRPRKDTSRRAPGRSKSDASSNERCRRWPLRGASAAARLVIFGYFLIALCRGRIE